MKEDLSMAGNEYNLLTTYWTIGYILGNIPSQLVLTHVPASIWLPSLELAWGFVVMGMAGTRNIETMYALRFVSGLLESSAYPGIMTLLGNWYTPAELGKRACIFQASSSAAQMFSGYLQAGLYSGMNGRAGLAAWRWLFIFDGIIGVARRAVRDTLPFLMLPLPPARRGFSRGTASWPLRGWSTSAVRR